jgi:hypothetical protein
LRQIPLFLPTKQGLRVSQNNQQATFRTFLHEQQTGARSRQSNAVFSEGKLQLPRKFLDSE